MNITHEDICEAFETSSWDKALSSNEGIEESKEEHVPHCNCKRSGCLKLYCECFASGVFCNDACNCRHCLNSNENPDARRLAIDTILDRNPSAFRPKSSFIAAGGHTKGCNCKKTGCLKKYCECFQAGIPCNDKCKCVMCKNNSSNPERASTTKASKCACKRKLKTSFHYSVYDSHRQTTTSSTDETLRKEYSIAVTNPLKDFINTSMVKKLCQDLVQAAANENSKIKRDQQFNVQINKPKEIQLPVPDKRVFQSPPDDPLFCLEESISSQTGNEWKRNLREEGSSGLLYSDQERAILEEFSACIRRIATAAAKKNQP